MRSHHVAGALIALAAIGLGIGTATAAPVKKANMPPFCRGEAAEKFHTKQAFVKTGKLVRAKDGDQLLKGMVDLRMQGTKKFECRFDAKGNFIDVKVLVGEAKSPTEVKPAGETKSPSESRSPGEAKPSGEAK